MDVPSLKWEDSKYAPTHILYSKSPPLCIPAQPPTPHQND